MRSASVWSVFDVPLRRDVRHLHPKVLHNPKPQKTCSVPVLQSLHRRILTHKKWERNSQKMRGLFLQYPLQDEWGKPIRLEAVHRMPAPVQSELRCLLQWIPALHGTAFCSHLSPASKSPHPAVHGIPAASAAPQHHFGFPDEYRSSWLCVRTDPLPQHATRKAELPAVTSTSSVWFHHIVFSFPADSHMCLSPQSKVSFSYRIPTFCRFRYLLLYHRCDRFSRYFNSSFNRIFPCFFDEIRNSRQI